MNTFLNRAVSTDTQGDNVNGFVKFKISTGSGRCQFQNDKDVMFVERNVQNTAMNQLSMS